MQKLKGAAGCLGRAVGCLAVIIVAFAIIDVKVWLSGHDELAIALLVGVAMLFSFLAASGWSALLIQRGAEIGVRSQESDNKLDIAQMKVILAMIQAMRQQGQQPALPMPQQQQAWLPPLDEISEAEFEEVPEPSLAQRLQSRFGRRKNNDG